MHILVMTQNSDDLNDFSVGDFALGISNLFPEGHANQIRQGSNLY